jgi:hypothetical protein
MTLGYGKLLDSLEDKPDRSAQYYAELENLPAIRDCGRAIAQYAMSLVTRGRLQREKKGARRFVLAPVNFVAFTPHYKRANHIAIELRGNPSQFEVVDGVKVKDARGGAYSRCILGKPSDLAAVISYVRQAHTNYISGPRKSQQTAKTP